MKKQLYLDIKNCLKSIVKNENDEIIYLDGIIETKNGIVTKINNTEVEEKYDLIFKHFDLWNRQVEFLEQETPFARPAIFIEFLPINWRQLGLHKQSGDCFVKIHIVTDWYAQTADNSPLELQMLEYLDLPNLVTHALMNFAPSSGNKFMRTQSETNHNHERLVDSIEIFKCEVIDTSATKQFETIQIIPVINIE